jgi:TetR/AcrR family transcriptional regulator
MTGTSSPDRKRTPVSDLGSRSEPTRLAILEAALKSFAKVGYETASTRAIAAAAGVHPASLRYHFADKAELWRAAIRLMFDRQRADFRKEHAEYPVDPDTLDGLKEMVRRYVRYSAAHPEHAQILVHEAIADTERLDWAVDAFVKANAMRMGDQIARQADAGFTRLGDARLTAIILSAASQMVFVLSNHLKRVFDEDVTQPAFVERLAAAMITLLFSDSDPAP